MLTVRELQSSTRKELLQELHDAQRTLQQLRIGIRTKNHKDTSEAPKNRAYVARIKTILREMELEEVVKQAKTLE